MTRHDEDGKPYFAYFRKDLTMGFCWDGDPQHRVQVQREMGEPIIAEFEIDYAELAQDHRPLGWLVVFRQACERFLREYGFDLDLDGYGECEVRGCTKQAANRFSIPGRFVSMCSDDIEAMNRAREAGTYGDWTRLNLDPVR